MICRHYTCGGFRQPPARMSYTTGAGAESYGAGIILLASLELALALALALMAGKEMGVDLSACRSDLSLPTPNASCRVVPVASCHADSLMSCPLIMSCHIIVSCHLNPCHVISCHVISCHVCHVMSFRVMSYGPS